MTRPAPPRPEFSRPVPVSAIKPGGESLTLAAGPAEAAALARRLGVEAVHELGATLRLVPKGSGIVAVTGRVSARLERLCVVTLEPLEEAIDEPVSVLFRPEDDAGSEVALDAEAEDEEPYCGSQIDLGELVSQTVALALDPWPRAPGASLPPEAAG